MIRKKEDEKREFVVSRLSGKFKGLRYLPKHIIFYSEEANFFETGC